MARQVEGWERQKSLDLTAVGDSLHRINMVMCTLSPLLEQRDNLEDGVWVLGEKAPSLSCLPTPLPHQLAMIAL